MRFEFETKYNPKDFEEEIYEKWLLKFCFIPDLNSKKEPFCIVMPPPNITGKLHMGHALDNVLQDVLIRFKKMNGFNTLWVVGVDHASIATEVKLVEQLKEQGLTKKEIGKEKFLDMAFKWKEKYEGNILNQLKKLGVACDWSRKRFTMDSFCSEAVLEFFVRLYKDGYIYRGERVINWCYCCKTSLSDAEVKFKEQEGNLYYVKYKFCDEEGFLEIATTRPETIFADVAVAVNPQDERFKKHIGKKVYVPLINREIPIIADSYVDVDFGTGAVKITPGHDFNDFEVGQRHNLKAINLFDENGRINSFGEYFENLEIKEARKNVVLKLKEEGFISKIEKILHNVGHCYRCDETVEPILSLQWFVKMEKLKDAAIDVVRNGEICFIPKRFEKTYFNWMENVKDWCISRQLWWGHEIPAYYCASCGHINVSKEKPSCCEKCFGVNLKKEEDTLDTWFSSALWPYSTLGWPDEEKMEYKTFYPTNVLVTGYDIIFFWVARMIFTGLYNTKNVPFKNVLIHGLVRDEEGRKMSKSLGNGVDPIKIIEVYGADALRFALANGVNAGNDLRFSEKKVIAARNFANKLWNAARFFLIQIKEIDSNFIFNFDEILNCEQFFLEDCWVLNKLNVLIEEVSKNINCFEISVATDKIYSFVWDVFCDWYLELFKVRRKNNFNGCCSLVLNIMFYVLDSILKLLHPFMPFITQKIYFEIFGEDKIILNSSWPKQIKQFNFKKQSTDFENIVEVITILRNFRSNLNLKNKIKIKVLIKTEFLGIFKECLSFIESLAFCECLELAENFKEEKCSNCEQLVGNSSVVYVLQEGLVDKEEERKKLLKEKEFLEKDITIFEKKLLNENFVKKAPKEVVEKEREKLEIKKEKLKNILFSLN